MTQTADLPIPAMDAIGVATEFKFRGGDEPGVFEGYGAINHNMDSHGDVIMPGAFSASLAEHKAAGSMPGLFVEHSAFKGGDPLPVGVWTSMEEDGTGLRVKGKLSALDTDHGRRLRSLMADGALRGLSIAFSIPPGGAIIGTKAGEPKRTLNAIDLHAVDIVRSPSNLLARVDHVRSLTMNSDHPAVAAIAAAMALRLATMAGGDGPTADERDALLRHLQDAHRALTGAPGAISPDEKAAPLRHLLPVDMKALTRPALEDLMQYIGLPRAAAKKVVAGGWPALSGSAVDPTPGFLELRARLTATILDLKTLKGQ